MTVAELQEDANLATATKHRSCQHGDLNQAKVRRKRINILVVATCQVIPRTFFVTSPPPVYPKMPAEART